MTKNSNLQKAKKEKNDEFYTRLVDIENELKHYRKHFKGKTILCNCDDPYESNFFKYFALNFKFFGLKKLICTCYAESKVAGKLFSFSNDGKKAYKIELTKQTKDYDGDGKVTMKDIEAYLRDKKNNAIVELKGDGDFRSEECIELLKEADIVISNPPFSLFREYIDVLEKYNKKFLIIGNKNAITNKEFFPLLKDNKVWIGYTSPSEFTLSDGNSTKKVNGLCRWFTNLDIDKRHEKIILWKHYDIEAYSKYDNFDAIDVPKVSEIPIDYDGIMGVPITIMDKISPEQFEIIWQASGNTRACCPSDILHNVLHYSQHPEDRGGCGVINGQRQYSRIFIRKKVGA